MENRINEIFSLIKILLNNKIWIKIVSSFSDAKNDWLHFLKYISLQNMKSWLIFEQKID